MDLKTKLINQYWLFGRFEFILFNILYQEFRPREIKITFRDDGATYYSSEGIRFYAECVKEFYPTDCFTKDFGFEAEERGFSQFFN